MVNGCLSTRGPCCVYVNHDHKVSCRVERDRQTERRTGIERMGSERQDSKSGRCLGDRGSRGPNSSATVAARSLSSGPVSVFFDEKGAGPAYSAREAVAVGERASERQSSKRRPSGSLEKAGDRAEASTQKKGSSIVEVDEL